MSKLLRREVVIVIKFHCERVIILYILVLYSPAKSTLFHSIYYFLSEELFYKFGQESKMLLLSCPDLSGKNVQCYIITRTSLFTIRNDR